VVMLFKHIILIALFVSFFIPSMTYAGDTYTKISSTGAVLPDSATEWSCVKQNATNLVWEAKTNDGGLHDKSNSYSWYNSNSSVNGGDVGTENGGRCTDSGNCDTEKFVQQVNIRGLCGSNNWRMPTKDELKLLVYCSNGPSSPLEDDTLCNDGFSEPTIDTIFFPNNRNSAYWPATASDSSDMAWSVMFYNGASYPYRPKNHAISVRLVRSGQSSTTTSSDVTTGVTTSVQSTTGNTFSITPTTLGTPTTTVPDPTALLTLSDSSTTVKRSDGSTVEVKANTLAQLNPTTNINQITLIRGEISLTVDCATHANGYITKTSLATINSCSSTQRAAADEANFTANYSQTGLNGTLTVSVASGTVDMVDRKGNTYTVTAGNEKTITNRVPRTQWVLPIDGDKLYGGESNFLIWTQFPDASSYQMEFNLPNPVFAENNVSTPQFTKQSIPFSAASLTKFEGLIFLPLPLPKGADGLVLELRIFALDAAGNIIGESTSSDSSIITVTD